MSKFKVGDRVRVYKRCGIIFSGFIAHVFNAPEVYWIQSDVESIKKQSWSDIAIFSECRKLVGKNKGKEPKCYCCRINMEGNIMDCCIDCMKSLRKYEQMMKDEKRKMEEEEKAKCPACNNPASCLIFSSEFSPICLDCFSKNCACCGKATRNRLLLNCKDCQEKSRKTKQLNVRPDSFWELRNGRKAYISYVYDVGDICYGMVLGSRKSTDWNKDGKWLLTNKPTGHDIIKEWEDKQ